MSLWRVAYAPHLGGGRHDAWRDGNVTDAKFQEIGGEPGMIFPFEGNLYQVVRNRAGATLAEGNLVKPYFGAAGRIGNLTGDSTKAIIETDDTFSVAGELAGTKTKPGYVFINAGTQIGERRVILDNSIDTGASTITVAKYMRQTKTAAVDSPDAYSAAPDATSDYSVVCPWEVTRSAAIGDKCMGVALFAAENGNWTIIQITGLALMLVDGTNDLAAGGVVAASGTAGVAAGFVTVGVLGDLAAATVAIDATRVAAASGVGIVLDAYTTDSAALRHVLLGGPGLVNPYREVTF